jgi:hypothetical protein
MSVRMSKVCSLALACATSLAAHAQPHEATRANLVLRASTVVSTAIDPAAARRDRIDPAPDRALLNVTLLRRSPGGAETTQRAKVSAARRDLAGITQRIRMRAVTENGRTSYLGVYEFLPREVVRIDVRAVPQGRQEAALRLTFRERMPPSAPAARGG